MTQKFRPYFTLAELEETISALKDSPNPARLSLASYLEIFKHKAESGLNQASYKLKTVAVEVKLGFDRPAEIVSLDQQKLAAYNKFSDPTQILSARETDLALLYKYENDLMTPEEEDSYQKTFIRSGD